MMRVSGLKRVAAAAAGALAYVAVAASPGGAAVIADESATGVTSTGPLPCANGGLGEDVTFTIDIHVLQASTVNGRRTSLTLHANLHGTGVGAITGDVYRFAATSNLHRIVDLASGQQVVTLTVAQPRERTRAGQQPQADRGRAHHDHARRHRRRLRAHQCDVRLTVERAPSQCAVG